MNGTLFDLIDAMDSFFEKDETEGCCVKRNEKDDGDVRYTIPHYPPVRFTRSKKTGEAKLKFELFGFKKEEIKLSFEKDFLVLSCKREPPAVDEDETVIVDNTNKPNEFEYKYFLPSKIFDSKTIEPKFEDSILTVTVQTREEEKPKEFEIK